MTWLFTQVWLWSSAAFMVGCLLTWLLFVRPLKKRLRALSEQPHVHSPDEPAHPESTTALDLLTESEEDEEPLIGDWDRRPRSWPRLPERPTPERTTPQRPAPELEWDVSERVDPADMDTREVRRISIDHDPPPHREPRQPDPPAPARPDSPPLPPPNVPVRRELESSPRPSSTSASTWFQKPDVGEAEHLPDNEWSGELPAAKPEPERPAAKPEPERPAAKPEPERPVAKPEPERPAAVSSQLRSLFEPLGSPDPEGAVADPVELGATQNIPRIEEPPENPEQSPLPRRTPGAGPRPGAQNLNSVANRSRETEEQPKDEAPEGAQRSSGSQDDYTIKGHFASRQYHTPQSPQYERIVAEVWFRTTSEAEQAGFEPWENRN